MQHRDSRILGGFMEDVRFYSQMNKQNQTGGTQVENKFSSQSRRITKGLKPPLGQLAKKPLLLTRYILCAHHKLSLRKSCSCPYRIQLCFCQAITPTCQITLSCAAITWVYSLAQLSVVWKLSKYISYSVIQLIKANTAVTQGQGRPLPKLSLYLLAFWRW